MNGFGNLDCGCNINPCTLIILWLLLCGGGCGYNGGCGNNNGCSIDCTCLILILLLCGCGGCGCRN